MNKAIEASEGELNFLRFFYKKMSEQCSEGGTDEDYWIKEEYEESGHYLPEGYGY